MRSLLAVLTLVAACSQPSGATVDGPPGGGDGATHHDAPPSGDGGLVATSAVSVIVEPNGNHGSELIGAISAAHTSIYMTMYEIDNSSMLSALVARKQAGLDVQAVLDGSSTTKTFNTPAYNQLKTAGINVVWASPTFSFTHEKTVIIDGSTAWIMTMNGNVSSMTSNREYLAVDTDAGDVAEATAVFKADHAMIAVNPSGNLVVANNNARPKLIELIDSATTTLDVEGEEFSDLATGGIVDAVVQAARHGIAVRVVIANSTPNSTAITLVKNAGGHVVVTGPTSGAGTPTNPYIHAKAITVDCTASGCARGFVGSENFSGGSLGYNRELGVILDVSAELHKIETAIDSDFSRGVVQ